MLYSFHFIDKKVSGPSTVEHSLHGQNVKDIYFEDSKTKYHESDLIDNFIT
jgi:hypothetical protein